MHNRATRQQAHVIALKKAAGGCALCPESDWRTLEFHHKDPRNKKATIGQMVRDRASVQEIDLEIIKCTLVCKNCHAKLHVEH